MLRKITLVAICMTAFFSAAAAQDKGIEIERAHARIIPANRMGAVYLTIVNGTKETDRLVSASTPMAGTAELHTTTTDNGVMKMRPVENGIVVKPGESAELKPGGLHIMLMNLKSTPKPGESFPLTLTFQKAGAVATTVTVDKPAGHGH